MNILVTGGLGYIGSHTCVALLEAGHSVIIIDNLSNSRLDVIEKINRITNREVLFYNFDITNSQQLEEVFQTHELDGVIHFAGYKAVGESVTKPLEYYYNNLVCTITLAQTCLKYNVKKIVFSSSATVYGENTVPFEENMNLLSTTNPYGETKAMCERILIDVVKANSELSVIILRYFNPIGAHESGLIGELPNGVPNNLMPYITQVAKRKLNSLKVFGNNYPTIDGTGIRDYIHVMDLAEGHVAAINSVIEGVSIYNVGTGKGTSVLELIKAFEQATNVTVPFDIVEPRLGDIACAYADVTKIKRELGWFAKRDIVTMCGDAWRFEKNQN